MQAVCAQSSSKASEWGLNLWFHSNWTGDAAFIDITRTMKEFAPFGSKGLTEQGIPLKGGTTSTFMEGYKGGTYVLRYDGKAKVSFGGSGSIVKGSKRVKNGHTYYDVHVKGGDSPSKLTMTLANVSKKDPIRNIRLISPGYSPNTKKVYRKEFLNKVKPFSYIRYMDWSRTNDSITRSWNDRRDAKYFAQTWSSNGKGGGVAWELLAEMSNESNNDAWINIPHKANNNYIRNLAKLWKKKLESGRKLYVEYSNEIWNPAFGQYDDLRAEGEKKYGKGASLYGDTVAPKLVKINRIFDKVFGKQKDRVEIVLAVQAANDMHVKKAMRYFEQKKIKAKDVIDAIAIAPYFNLTRDKKFKNYEEAVKDLMDHKDERQWVRRHKKIADEAGVDLIAYEGGVNSDYRKSIPDEWRKKIDKDPRLAKAYKAFDKMWREEGGGVMSQYSLTSVGKPWGMLDHLGEETSVKYEAVMDIVTGLTKAARDARDRKTKKTASAAKGSSKAAKAVATEAASEIVLRDVLDAKGDKLSRDDAVLLGEFAAAAEVGDDRAASATLAKLFAADAMSLDAAVGGGFDTTASPVLVPEPASVALLFAGGLLTVRRPRRR